MSQIAQACLYRNNGTVLVDFRETGATGWETALADTDADLLALGYVRMEDPDRGDEYQIPIHPNWEEGPTRTEAGILHAPQVAAIIRNHYDGVEGYDAKPPREENEVEVPSPEQADLIIRSFRNNVFALPA